MAYNKSRQGNKTLSFIKKATIVKKQLEGELNAHKLGQGKDGTINQLEQFYQDIERMIESESHSPIYLRVIVDTWDYNSELGKQLLDLYELYKDLDESK
ncbi:hypothetical protein [Halalkalibacter sp. APA_J-10(15)]|uniref:hypothetical protein n=1 Tax=Halalkalibacter sp. APA_J-10(15) TaxID=2933805 RepID=UPI001FF12839|nr:hypothetical protein [Halalkalibacter sp. APA_J-10(15)]MCK0473850.1 hypothetical protein [Halalkalibacter sp. APA_J-10(15)]